MNITEGGGTGSTTANTVSTIQLADGALDMTGHDIGDAINTLTLDSCTLNGSPPRTLRLKSIHCFFKPHQHLMRRAVATRNIHRNQRVKLRR